MNGKINNVKITRKRDYKKWWIFVTTLLVLASLVTALFWIKFVKAPAKSTINLKQKTSQATNVSPNRSQTVFSKSHFSVTDPASIWVIVNKKQPLQPINYIPADLAGIDDSSGATISSQISSSLSTMIKDAKLSGINLIVQSGYRSYSYQTKLYNNYVAKDGQPKADTYSARPGFSEHQTGLAVDIGGLTQPECNLEQCFGSSSEGKWLANNAEKYGFIIRYQDTNKSITGYTSEPWHIRYVGTELTDEMKKQDITTLEEFFKVTGGDQY